MKKKQFSEEKIIGILKEQETEATMVGLSRSVWQYCSSRPTDARLRTRLKALAEQFPGYGCPTLHGLLRAEGLVRNLKRTYRLYCEEKLQVRRKQRKKLHRPHVPMSVPRRRTERWSIRVNVSDSLSMYPFRVAVSPGFSTE